MRERREAVKPGEILARGQAHAMAGRHAEALRDFQWFHDHALDHDPAFYGVRLSFALAYWRELARRYEPALAALLAVKGRGEDALRRGEGDRALFHDVVSINRELDRTGDTYGLFIELAKSRPDLAKSVGHLALEAIVEAGDHELAARQLPHPETYLLWLAERLNGHLAMTGLTRTEAAHRREALVGNYGHDVRLVLRILAGLGNRAHAEAARLWAIALVGPKAARTMAAKQLAPADRDARRR